MKRVSLGVVMVALLLSTAQPVAAIVYGEVDTAGTYPNVGAMLVDTGDGNGKRQWCTGTLIWDGVLLTAAHCIVPLQDDHEVSISFSAGHSSASYIQGTDYDRHPLFGKAMGNLCDVGVLLFDAPDAAEVEPAPIVPVGSLDDLKQLRRQTFTTVGYGVIRETRKKGPQGILDNTSRRVAEQELLSRQKAGLTLSMNEATGNGGTCYGTRAALTS